MRLMVGRPFATLLLAGLLAAGVACTKAPDDGQLTAQIQSKFHDDSGLQGKQITVETAGGVVTLSGAVDNDTQRAPQRRVRKLVRAVFRLQHEKRKCYTANGHGHADQGEPCEEHREKPGELDHGNTRKCSTP